MFVCLFTMIYEHQLLGAILLYEKKTHYIVNNGTTPTIVGYSIDTLWKLRQKIELYHE